jgi:hypothetical protein
MDTFTGLLLKKDFPNLNWDTFDEKSRATLRYNCIAFAAGDRLRRWWPNIDDHHWPSAKEGVPQEETLEAFVAAFGTLKPGYLLCGGSALESGFEKVAIYVNPATGKPSHAAHQLPNGRWESKLGRGIDIQHDSLEELDGPLYGTAVCFLSRPIGVVEHEGREGSKTTGEFPQQQDRPPV